MLSRPLTQVLTLPSEQTLSLELSLDLYFCVCLQHVSLTYVVEVDDRYTAFEVASDLLDIILESLEGEDFSCVDNDAVGYDTHLV